MSTVSLISTMEYENDKNYLSILMHMAQRSIATERMYAFCSLHGKLPIVVTA